MQLLQTTSFTCCAHDHFVGSCAQPLRAEEALRPPACGPALAGSGRRFGHILACGEDATSQNVKVKPALADIAENMKIQLLILLSLAQLINCAKTSTQELLNGAFLNQLKITPADPSVSFSGQIQFAATGGTSPYSFSLVSGSGSLDSSNAIFTAPSAIGSAVIRVMDKTGARDFSVISIIQGTALVCPTNYILVPANSAVGMTADFCVAKYEMKCNNDSTGAACVGTPISQSSNQPWVNVDQATAKTLCSSLGSRYHLITNPEWMTLARNIEATAGNWDLAVAGVNNINQGHSDGTPGNSLAANTDTSACFGTGQTCSDSVWNSQRRTFLLSNGAVIWDLAGNVAEWINWNVSTGKASPQNAYIEINTTAVPTGTMTSATFQSNINTLTSAKGIGDYYPGLNGSGGAALRSGLWYDGVHSGVYTLGLDLAASGYSNTTIGFRCTMQ